MLTPLRSRSLATLTKLASVASVASVALLSSCSVTSDDAIRINGTSLSNDDFDQLLTGYSSAVEGATLTSGNVNTVVARGILQDWITTIVLEGVLDEAGVQITDEQREAAKARFTEQAAFQNAPVDVQNFYLRATAALEATTAAFAPSKEELAALYAKGPIESDVVCLRLILTDTREQMDVALFRIAAGESFADVAAATSTDVSAAEGGIFTDQQTGSECIQQSTLATQIVPEFVTALETAEVGVVGEPFEVAGAGWVTILLRPFDEVADSVSAVLGPAAANRVGRDALTGAKIWIKPEYGRWDPQTQQIVDVDR